VTAVRVLDLGYLGRPESVAAYLVIGPLGPVLIETGPGSTSDALERGLAEHGVKPRDVRDALVTHIHLDHAGAAGWLASHGARIHVHEFGAPHLIDPSRLIASATRIYGDDMNRLWGEVLAVPERQVMAVRNGDIIDAGGMHFRTIETPGHARHHHAYALEEANDQRVAFTGDAAACFIADAPEFISLPTPPPEFDLLAWLDTLQWLEREEFDALYPTHFGRVDDPAAHLARVRSALEQHCKLVQEMMQSGLSRDDMVVNYRTWFTEQAINAGVPASHMAFYVKDSLAEMNLTGMIRYLERNQPVGDEEGHRSDRATREH